METNEDNMQKIFSIILIGLVLLFGKNAFAATTASQTISATLSRGGGGGGGGGGIPGGAIVGIAGGGSAAAGASALAFAPLLLAGLTPDGVVSAAAPICCIPCTENLLQSAIMHSFCSNDYNEVLAKMNCNGKFYIAQNNESIRNGSFDMQQIVLPPELLNAQKIRINITIASENYKEINGEPELVFGIYKDIAKADLSKKFETQQFLHHYLMKKYDVPLKITEKSYNCGVQKLTGILNLNELNMKNMPFQTVVRFTENGFQRNQLRLNPKVKFYAYLLEFEKIS